MIYFKVRGIMLRSDILRMPTVAYYSGYNGIEIKEIKGDLVYCVSGTFFCFISPPYAS